MVPGFKHVDVKVPIVYNVENFDDNIDVDVDVDWLDASILDNLLLLEFSILDTDTAQANATARLTLSDSFGSVEFVVSQVDLQYSFMRLIKVPETDIICGLVTNKYGPGALVFYDTSGQLDSLCRTLGEFTNDFVLSQNRKEILVLSSVDKTIETISLSDFSSIGTHLLLSYLPGRNSSSDYGGHLELGDNDIIYYVDNFYSSALRVYDRSTEQVLQTFGNTGSNSFGTTYGDIFLNSDRDELFVCTPSTTLERYSIGSDGRLTFLQSSSYVHDWNLSRYKWDTPSLFSAETDTIYVKQGAFSASDITKSKGTYPLEVCSLFSSGSVAITSEAIYDTENQNKLFDLPYFTRSQVVCESSGVLYYYNWDFGQMLELDLVDAIGKNVLSKSLFPEIGSIVNTPEKISWNPVSGVISYQVYWGDSASGIRSANTDSPYYLGATLNNDYDLSPFSPEDGEYFWRVDLVTERGTLKGEVFSYVNSFIEPESLSIATSGITGNYNRIVEFGLNVIGDRNFEVRSDKPWVVLDDNSYSLDDEKLIIKIDESFLSIGSNNAVIQFHDANGLLFSIPLEYKLYEKDPTLIVSAKSSPLVYCISQAVDSPAFLVEINAINGEILRVVEVSSSVSDLDVNESTSTLYLVDSLMDILIELDLYDLSVKRQFKFSSKYSDAIDFNEIYWVSSGIDGKVVVEEANQHSDIRILDLDTSTILDSERKYSGDGVHSADGEHYYHATYGVSNANITKYSVATDLFEEVRSSFVNNAYNSGRRRILISQDGKRIFWSGNVYNSELVPKWEYQEFFEAITENGNFAFSQGGIFDVQAKEKLADMPSNSGLISYNDTARKLIYKSDQKLHFMPFEGEGWNVYPQNSSIIREGSYLSWKAAPSAKSYQIYLGSEADSLEYIGSTTLPIFNFEEDLDYGNYFWRVVAVTDFGIVTSQLYSFTRSPLVPDIGSVNLRTLSGFRYNHFSANISGNHEISWVATSQAPWCEVTVNAGVTPSSMDLNLNAFDLKPGNYHTSVDVMSGEGDLLFSLPVFLQVDPLNLTHLVSDANSENLFAISAIDDGAESTYLLKIDSAKEEIVRVIRYEKKITDINFHGFDDALYALSPEENVLYSLNMEDLSTVETLSLPDRESWHGFVKNFASASPGHVVTYDSDGLELCDLSTGLSVALARASGDALESDHSSSLVYLSQSSGFYPAIRVFDTTLGTLKYELPDYAQFFSFDPGFYVDYDGDPSLVISDNSSQLFWNGYVIDSLGTEEWKMDDVVYGCTGDGRYAFTESTIYDVLSRQAVLGMPNNRKIFEYNTTSQKLVLQEDEKITFYPLVEPLSLVSPDLELIRLFPDAVELIWTDSSLETEFIIEYRKSGELDWHQFSESIGMNVTTGIFSGLEPNTNYEMRAKAVAYGTESEWGTTLEVQTLDVGLGTPNVSFDLSYLKTSTFYPANVYIYLDWPLVDGAFGYRIERSVEDGPWALVDSLDQDTPKFSSGVLSLGVKYAYRVRAFDSSGFSLASETFYHDGSFTRLPEVPEYFFAITESKSSIRLIWAKTLYEHGYTVERWNGALWERIKYLPANVTEYLDTDLVEGQTYRYRVYGTGVGSSQKSNEDRATARDLTPVVRGDQILADVIFVNLIESDGVVSLLLSGGNLDSELITYYAKLEATLSFDSETLQPKGITFSDGLILSSDWSLKSSADMYFIEEKLTLLSDLGISSRNIKQRLLTGLNQGMIDSSGYIIPAEHIIETFSGILSLYLQPAGDGNYYYESVPLLNENFEINPSNDTFSGYGEISLVQISFNPMDRYVKTELLIEIDDVFEQQILGTNSSFIFTESSRLTFSTNFNFPSLYRLWAINNGIILENEIETNALGVPYALNYAFNKSPDSAGFATDLQFSEDNRLCVCLNLPKDGLLASLVAYYTDDLGSDLWEPLNLDYYVDGANSLDKGRTGLVRFEFPEGDQGFIKFVVDFSDISTP